MLARVAENIYWLSRYLERAENTVRLVDVHSRMLLDIADVEDHTGWIALITINALDEEFNEKYALASESNVCDFLLADTENPGSLLNTFIAIQQNLRSCRDIMPRSTYEAINGACRFVRQQVSDAAERSNHRQAFLDSVRTRLLAIYGDINSNMSHDIGYRFMRIGCDIERADMTSRIIDVQSSRLTRGYTNNESMPLQQQRWVSVLRTLSAGQMYRQHVRRPINGYDTLRFLLHDTKLPRSYHFCINHLEGVLTQFNNNEEPLTRLGAVRDQLMSADLQALALQPLELHQYIDTLQMNMQSVAVAISETYFLPPSTS